MEENGEPFNDWEALVVQEFESKPIVLETDDHHQPMHDHDELQRNIDGISISDCLNNGNFRDNENVVVLDDYKKSCSSSSSPELEFKGSIAERRAAKFGFDASRMNVAKFNKVNSGLPSSPPPPLHSPYLTIPPGISPAALLDSPVMLPNAQAQPSPTTGTLQLQQCNHDSLVLNSVGPPPAVDGDKDTVIHTSALFKPPAPLPCSLAAENQLPTTYKSPPESTKEDSLKNCAMDTCTETKVSENLTQNNLQPNGTTNIARVQLPQLRECIKGETGVHGSMQEDHKGTYNPAAATELTRNAEDGYSWRKYGQKHVKGSEYPRSYYKCNNSSCPVKKKVERSHDGEITEIIYKGAHNHPKPHPRISLGHPTTSSCELMETTEGSEPCLKVESGTSWRFNNQLRSKDLRIGSDWRPDGLERTSSTSLLADILDPLATTQGKCASLLGTGETPELASRTACQDGEDEDGATQGSTSQGDEADDDESEPKRRKKEIFSTEAYVPSRSNREPRVIVQIESEIDVLDDGYRWRKYGQKVVKGNPNPRSYYKCTSAGCPVRKHVERASDDIKSVLTTYEGKHNHEVPTTRTSGLPGASNSPPEVSNPNPSLTVSRNPNVPTREMQVQDLPLHYEMKPSLGSDFMRSNLLCDFVNDMQIGPSSIYPLKFPPTHMPSSIPYGSFVMNTNGSDTHTSCQKFTPVMPDFPISLPLNVARSSTNVALNNNFHPYNHNHAIQSGTILQSSIGDQHIREGDLRFLRPKEEKKDDTIYDPSLTTPDNTNVTSSTAFCRVMGNFPS